MWILSAPISGGHIILFHIALFYYCNNIDPSIEFCLGKIFINVNIFSSGYPPGLQSRFSKTKCNLRILIPLVSAQGRQIVTPIILLQFFYLTMSRSSPWVDSLKSIDLLSSRWVLSTWRCVLLLSAINIVPIFQFALWHEKRLVLYQREVLSSKTTPQLFYSSMQRRLVKRQRRQTWKEC